MNVVNSKRIAPVPAKSARRGRKNKKTKSKKGLNKKDVLQIIEGEKEIKRLWGTIREGADYNDLQIPTGTIVPEFIYSEGLDMYYSNNLVFTKQGLETENRIGASVKPLRFTCKGYGMIDPAVSGSNTNTLQTHVRVVFGFRRQSAPLNILQYNLQLEGGKQVALSGTYRDVIRPFNWKEFRPFYDKTFTINPTTYIGKNFTNPFVKDHFHFNVDYKYSLNHDFLTAFEDVEAADVASYNNNNVYCLFIARQMNNDNLDLLTQPCSIFAESCFSFTDA